MQPKTPARARRWGWIAVGVAVLSSTLAPITGLPAAFAAVDTGRLAYDGGGILRTVAPDGTGGADVVSGGSEPAWSSDGTRIAYQRSVGGQRDVFVADADGSNEVVVAATPAWELDPAWFPDGASLLLTRDDRMKRVDLATGAETDLGAGYGSSVSADGSMISFQQSADVWVMAADGSGRRRLTNTPDADGAADFSPDGSTLLFARASTAGDEIFAVPVAGGPAVRLTDGRRPSWSPDGTRFVVERRATNWEIWTLAADGSDARRVLQQNSPPGGVDWGPGGAPPDPGPTITVEPATDLERGGQAVSVSGSGWPAGGSVTIEQCEPSSFGSQWCADSPVTAEVGSDGAFSTAFSVTTVNDRQVCLVEPCLVRVTDSAGTSAESPIAFRSAPSAPPQGFIPPYADFIELAQVTSLEARDLTDPDGIPVAVEVDWGDGSQESVAVPGGQNFVRLGHRYAAAGAYRVHATVVDDSGTSASAGSRTVYVSKLVATLAPAQGSLPRSVVVDLSNSTPALPPTSFELVLDDGTTVSSTNPRFPVELTQASSCGFTVRIMGTDPDYGYEQTLAMGATPACVASEGPGQNGIVGSFWGDIWSLVAGNGDQRLTTGPADDRFPRFDETGTRVVFERGGDLWLLGSDGDVRRLTATRATESDGGDLHGDEVVFTRVDGVIRALDIDTGAERVVWDGAGDARFPRWSPDGSTIAFAVGGQLWTVAADGGGAHAVLTGHTTVTRPAWSPDGRRLAFVSFDAGRIPRLWVVDVDGTDAAPVGPGLGLAGGFPAFSPTGDQLVFGVPAGDGGDIRTVALDGSDEQFVDTGYTPDWAPGAGAGGGDDEGDTTTYVVTPTTGEPVDDGCNPAPGDCTLAEAIEDGNDADPLEDVVISLPSGTITPTEPLPEITRPVTIIGGGATEEDAGHGIGVGSRNCAGVTTISGSRAGAGAIGLRVRTGTAATGITRIHGVAVVGFDGDGLRVSGSRRVRVACSRFGAENFPNGGDGIDVRDSRDVAVVGDVDIEFNGGDGIAVTGASRRIRTWDVRARQNGGLFVDLGGDGPTANDAGDGDVGPNGLVNAPALIRRRANPMISNPAFADVIVRVDHDTSTGPFRVDLYDNITCDEAYHWIGTMTVDLSGTTTRYLRIRPFLPGPGPITATVTTGAGTSELSGCLEPGGDAEPGGAQSGVDPTEVGPEGSGDGGAGGDGSGGSGGSGGTGDDIDDDGHGEDSGLDEDDENDDEHDDDGGEDEGGGGVVDPPVDDAPTSPGYLIIGPAGAVTVDAEPGALDGATGDPTLRVERAEGGDMDPADWSLAPDGTVTMDATGLGAGTWSGRFVVVDGDGDRSEPATIVFVVTDGGQLPVEDVVVAPLARPDTVTVAPGNRVLFANERNLLVNDSSGGRDPMVAERVAGGTAPADMATVHPDGRLLVDARGRPEGTFTLNYRNRLGDGTHSNVTTVTIRIDNANSCPVARNDRYVVASGEQWVLPAALGVLANDEDAEGGRLTASLVGTFTAGDIALRSDGGLRFDARGDAPGSRREFQYHAVDSRQERCAPATVRIDVAPNLVPTTLPNIYDVYPGMRLVVPALGVLGGDLDPDGPESGLQARAGATRLRGLSIQGSGGLTFDVPRTARVGTTLVATYVAIDHLGGRSAETEVRFVVKAPADVPPPNIAPQAADDLFYRVHADQLLVVGAGDGVLANDDDPDGDALYAEPIAPTDDMRIPIRRDGGFTFQPTLADIGQTFTQRYYAAERTFEAARSPIRTVRVEVVAPITRCTYADIGVDTVVVDDSSQDATVLVETDWSFRWCWDRRTVSGLGFTDSDDEVVSPATPGAADTEIDSALDAQLGIVPGLGAEDTEDATSTLSGAGAASGLFAGRGRSQVCLNPVDLVLEFVSLGKALKRIPVIGEDIAQYLDDLGEVIAASRYVRQLAARFDGISGRIVANAVEALPVVGPLIASILRGGSELPMEVIDLLLEEIAGTTVEAVAEEGGPVTMTLDTVFGLLVDDDDENDVSITSLLTCVPLGGLGYLVADAQVFASTPLRNNGYTGFIDSSGVEGYVGFFGGLAQAFDLSNVGSATIDWQLRTGEPERRDRTCDYTRVRPDQVPTAPPPLPGEQPVRC